RPRAAGGGRRRPAPARDRRGGGARARGRPLPRRARAGGGAGARGHVRGAAGRGPRHRRGGGGRGGEGALGRVKAPVSLRGRDFLRVRDFSREELETVLDLAAELKAHPRPLLPQKTLGRVFVTLTPDEMQLSRGESVHDTAHVLSRYLDALAIRILSHEELEAWAEGADIPVINALTSAEHPCQALADVLTIRERLGGLEGVRVAWVGDGTNVL